MAGVLFEDVFTLNRMNPNGKTSDIVSEIEAQSVKFDIFMLLDVNTEIYPLHVGDKFIMALNPTLYLDGTPDSSSSMQGGRKSIGDKFEYIMHGMVFKLSGDTSKDPGGPTIMEVHVSCGGLIMMLRGERTHLSRFDLDQRLFLLIRKI